MNDINDIIPKSSGSVSFFYPSWLPQSPPLPGAVPLRIKMEPNMAVTLKSALAALAALLASNTIILCSGWAPLTQESWEVHPDAAEVFHDCCMNHPMAYIYIIFIYLSPLKFLLQNAIPQGRYRMVFGYHFVQKNWPWVKPYCKGTPPWPDVLYRFWGFATPVPTILYGVWRGLISDHYKLDGFKTGMDNAQL